MANSEEKKGEGDPADWMPASMRPPLGALIVGVDTTRCVARLERCKSFHFEPTELLIAILSYCVWRETKARLWSIVPVDAAVRNPAPEVL